MQSSKIEVVSRANDTTKMTRLYPFLEFSLMILLLKNKARKGITRGSK